MEESILCWCQNGEQKSKRGENNTAPFSWVCEMCPVERSKGPAKKVGAKIQENRVNMH